MLADKGYTEAYIDALKLEIDNARGEKAKAEGQGYLACAYLFMGQLSKSAETFETINSEKIGNMQGEILFANMELCYFLMGKNQKADEIYKTYNEQILAGKGVTMKRSLAIHEYVQERYENAVTVLVKISSESDPRDTLFIDICLIKTFIKLDMFDRAYQFSSTLDRYNNKGELTEEVQKIRKKIFDNLSTQKKQNNIKKRKK